MVTTELWPSQIRARLTGTKKEDVGKAKRLPVLEQARRFSIYCDRRQARLDEWKRHVPQLLAGRTSTQNYVKCLGGSCNLHLVCEHCWFNNITMPLVRSLCGVGYVPKGRNENLYLVAFTGVVSAEVQSPRTAAGVIGAGRHFFKELLACPVFHAGGVISGVAAYHYLYRTPWHRRFDERHLTYRSNVSGSPRRATTGWSPRVVMLVRSTLDLPKETMQRYLILCLDWVRNYTPAQLTDPKLEYDSRMELIPTGYFTPDIGRGCRYSLLVRRMKTVGEAVHRYSCGRLVPPNKDRTRTSDGRFVVRDLRLPLLECSADEAALLLDWSYVPLPGRERVTHQQMTGDFVKHERPQSTWMTLMGPLRNPTATTEVLKWAGLWRPPMTTDEDAKFEAWLSRAPIKRQVAIASKLGLHGKCSQLSKTSRLRSLIEEGLASRKS